MNWQWIEDFIIAAAAAEAEMRRRAVVMTEEQAMRFVWAASRPAGEA